MLQDPLMQSGEMYLPAIVENIYKTDKNDWCESKMISTFSLVEAVCAFSLIAIHCQHTSS